MKLIEKINKSVNVKYVVTIITTEKTPKKSQYSYYSWRAAVDAAVELAKNGEYYEIERVSGGKWMWSSGIIRGGGHGSKPHKGMYCAIPRDPVGITVLVLSTAATISIICAIFAVFDL